MVRLLLTLLHDVLGGGAVYVCTCGDNAVRCRYVFVQTQHEAGPFSIALYRII